MKSPLIIALLLSAVSILAGLFLKVSHISAANPILVTSIFVAAISGVLYVLQSSKSKEQN